MMNTAFPRFPKRRLVMARAWAKEPQDHQIQRNSYRGRMFNNLNPWMTEQLRRDENFNVTHSDI